MILLKHELRSNFRSLLIWAGCVGTACLGCLLLFEGIKDSIEPMAELYGEMGAFSVALGMDQLNVASMEGYFATEIALIFAVGGAMFAAKEEQGHTAEFLYTLPFDRVSVVLWKYGAMALLILLFQLVCIGAIALGLAGAGESLDGKTLALYYGSQLLMQLEVGSVCFLLSALCPKKQIGAALGFSVLLYMADVMCRIVPDLEILKYATPFYFSNAADIFVNKAVESTPALIGLCVLLASPALAAAVYQKRDINA